MGREFGDYEIEHKLGQGGMGIVYKAYETKIKRVVALKIISHGDENMVSRFQKEMEILGKLQHPNIVRLLSYGTDPQIYLTMEYLEGKSLAEINNLSFRQIAKVIQKVALALQDAHDRGIIHRDIKPANIMLVGKEPKLMDFGLAKLQQDDEQISKTGELLGTVAYMSPEQAYGNPLGNSTDIYSLGATLYKLLTSRPPFEGDNNINIIFRVCYQDAISPRALNPDIPVDLEAICLKCLEKDPRKRYSSAKSLADDLQNFLQGQSVTARPYTPIKKVYKFILRHKLTFALTTLCILLTIIFTVVHIQYLKKSRLQAAEKHKSSSKILAKFASYNADIKFNVGLTRESGLLTGRSLQFLEGLSGEDIGKIRNGTRKMLYRNLRHYGLVQRYLLNEEFPTVQHIAFNQNGDLLAMINEENLQIWDIPSHKIIAKIKHSIQEVSDIFMSEDKRTFIFGKNGIVYHYNGKKITEYCDVPKSISIVKWEFPDVYFVSGKNLHVLNIEDKKTTLIRECTQNITHLDISTNSVVYTSSSHVHVYNKHTHKIQKWRKPKKMRSMTLCHDGQYIASYYDGYLRLFDIQGNRISRKKQGNFEYDNFGKVELYTAPFNDNIVFTVSYSEIIITDFFVPENPALIGYFGNDFHQIAIHPHAKYVATTNKNGVYLWDRSFALQSFNIPTKKVRKLRFHRSQKLVVLQNQISVWRKDQKLWTSTIQNRIIDFRIDEDYIIVKTKLENIIFTMTGKVFYRCPQQRFLHIEANGSTIVYYSKKDHCICVEDIKNKMLQKITLSEKMECTSLVVNSHRDIFYTLTNNNDNGMKKDNYNTTLCIVDKQLKKIYSKKFSVSHEILKCIKDRIYVFTKDAHLKIIDRNGQVLENIVDVLNTWHIKEDYIVFLRNAHAIVFETNADRKVNWIFPVEGAYDVDFIQNTIVFACPRRIHVRNIAHRLTMDDFKLHKLISSTNNKKSLSDYVNEHPQKFTEQVFDGKLDENFETEYAEY
ncbi:serine/threonine protein kinase [Candidatus Uabimicrobium amorphum]